MDAAYSVRRAAADDIPTIIYHRRRMFEDMGQRAYLEAEGMDAAYTAWITPRLAEGQYVGWLALCEGEVVGGAGAELYQRHPNPVDLTTQRAHLVNVYVEPAHRRRGIARLLVQTALDWCRSEGIRTITLQASAEGQPLYEKMGFRMTREMILVFDSVLK